MPSDERRSAPSSDPDLPHDHGVNDVRLIRIPARTAPEADGATRVMAVSTPTAAGDEAEPLDPRGADRPDPRENRGPGPAIPSPPREPSVNNRPTPPPSQNRLTPPPAPQRPIPPLGARPPQTASAEPRSSARPTPPSARPVTPPPARSVAPLPPRPVRRPPVPAARPAVERPPTRVATPAAPLAVPALPDPVAAPPVPVAPPPIPVAMPYSLADPWGQGRAIETALKRPWQTTFLAWWCIIGAVVGVLTSVALLVLTITGASYWYDYAYYDSWLAGWGTVVMVLDIIALVTTGLQLWAGLLLLRGSRGAYIYFTVITIINLVTVGIALVLLVVLLVLSGLVLFTAADGTGGGGAVGPSVVLVVVFLALVLVVPIFFSYLLWNRRTREYFSPQSVRIREQYRDGR
ncbi:hypothetical protein MYK68_00630 [Gordonia sp. PP30]|uniref:hypothetical protein n=1 Tax=Gordonia sp. PP30 TaxID=2935861 RepID=UPI001FFEFC65|nr:hypothetical protein [Gordonia sp. PP30]UQE75186.1 hypothetical protein MYK68_00630 [Gordonia sp. PP30]